MKPPRSRACLFLFPLACIPAASQTAPSSVARKQGLDAPTQISWVLLSIDGALAAPAPAMTKPASQPLPAPTPPPRLTAVCSKTPEGKLRFDMMADYVGVPEVSFVAPWRRSKDEVFPPVPHRENVLMEFLGYKKEKKKLTWEWSPGAPGEMQYSAPGSSSNLETAAYQLLYLRSLPTLRLTVQAEGSVEFATMPWLNAIAAEPLCRASGLG